VPRGQTAGSPTRSDIEGWDTSDLVFAARIWREAASESENAFDKHRQNVSAPGGTAWEGDAKDAALDRVTADLKIVGRHVRVLCEAADAAESGSRDVQSARSKAVDAIVAAEADGFRVGEDLSVTDTRLIDVASLAARNAAATEHAEDIRWTAQQLAQTDTLVGRRLQDKAAELDGIRFDGDDSIQLVDNRFSEAPPTSPEDPRFMTREQALADWALLRKDWDEYRLRCTARPFILPTESGAFQACNASYEALHARQAALESRLRELGVEFAPTETETTPGTSGTPNITSVATQIGQEVSTLPPGTRADALADRLSALNLGQAEAAQATNIASRSAFGETAGIAKLPDGSSLVLPARIDQQIAMKVAPDGSVSVFRGDLNQFLPYLG
jgi:hypothetical protein